jgi:hypothetical protein
VSIYRYVIRVVKISISTFSVLNLISQPSEVITVGDAI